MAIITPTPIRDEQKVRLFSRRELIPQIPNVLWRIERGAIRTLTWNQEGTLLTLGYWGAGDVVGQNLSRVQPLKTECCTSVEVIKLPQYLWQQALDAILHHAQQTEELLSIVHCHRVYLRLWLFLQFLGRKFGRDVGWGRLIDLPITHQEIAQATNMTRVSVTRTLQQLQAEGKLQRKKRRLILCQD